MDLTKEFLLPRFEYSFGTESADYLLNGVGIQGGEYDPVDLGRVFEGRIAKHVALISEEPPFESGERVLVFATSGSHARSLERELEGYDGTRGEGGIVVSRPREEAPEGPYNLLAICTATRNKAVYRDMLRSAGYWSTGDGPHLRRQCTVLDFGGHISRFGRLL